MKFRLHAFLCSLLALACHLLSGAMPSCAEPVEPTLDLTPTAQTLITGQPLQLTVTRRFPGGSIEDVTGSVTYTSSTGVDRHGERSRRPDGRDARRAR